LFRKRHAVCHLGATARAKLFDSKRQIHFHATRWRRERRRTVQPGSGPAARKRTL
jgi:hypothetical protein